LKKKVIISIVVAFVLSIAGTAFGAASQTFADVPVKHWAYAAVTELARVGIIDGYEDGSFRGDKTISRYEMAQIVEKAMANSDKATAVQKALIDKLAIEFALELNKIDTRVTALEKKQPNLTFTGSYQTQYKVKEALHPELSGYAKGQYKLQLNGKAKVDDSTMLGFRFADPAPTATRFRDSTQSDYGDVGDNALKLDRIFAVTKIGGLKATIGRQALSIDSEDFIVDSNFFSFDGVKLAWKMGGVDVDVKRGRFARKVTDTYAFNGHDRTDFANVDIDTVNLAGKDGNLDWNAGWASFRNNVDNKGGLMSYYFGSLYYLFADNFSMGTEMGRNTDAFNDDGKFWSVKGVYGAQSLNAKGKQNFTAQYTHVGNNAIATAYTSLDQISEGVSDKFTTLDFNYRYAFSKNMVGKIQRTYVRDKVDDTESYNVWKVQMVYKF
jgi:hypothetical protein